MIQTFYSHLDYPGRGTVSTLFSQYYHLKEVQDPDQADVIVWNGGEDIGTSIYLEHPVTRGIPYEKSRRDVDEIALFNEYRNNKSKLLLGICRGSQLLNCLNGGSLYQDVNGHNSGHDMIDLRTKEIIKVTSTHHQQMIAAKSAGEIIGVASCSTYKNHEAGSRTFTTSPDLRHGADVEIMWYPETRSLCIQGHPEYVPGSRFASYTLQLITECYNKSVLRAA